MANQVIRVGGSFVGNAAAIQNLQHYAGNSGKRKFVVISAIPELHRYIANIIDGIFNKPLEPVETGLALESFFTSTLAQPPSENYNRLSEQLINLLKGIALIGDYSPALKAQVLSFGEKLSAEILLAQWHRTDSNCSILWPEELELEATSDYSNATFLSLNREKADLLPDSVYIVPGSYGIDSKGKIARAGKTAADYSAAALASFLDAGQLELWALDNEFRKADPAIVENPPIIHRLTYHEASELAYFDHYSFHPRTVEPLEQRHIPIVVLNPFKGNGTVETVINTDTFVDDKIVKSVACSDDISLLKLEGPGVGLKPGILARVTTQLNKAGINIKSVITSQTSINLILEKETGKKAIQLINNLGFTSVQEIRLNDDVSLIGIIGHGMQQNYGVSARIFNAVAQHQINVVLSGSGASDLVSYLVVKSADKQKSVRVIYDAFFK